MQLKFLNLCRFCIIILAAGIIQSCVQTTANERARATINMVSASGWQAQEIHSGQFYLQAFMNHAKLEDGLLTLYVEGDGHAWIDGRYASDDPTPISPVALKLAIMQPSGSVAYLARPCQYIGVPINPACAKALWTNERFSEKVISSMNGAIDQLKAQTHASKIRLVGYSGGAAVILLIAARRNDIVQLVTVAGNLDPVAWTKYMNLSPLEGSLNTAENIAATQHIPQVDFIGGKDQVVPPEISMEFIRRYPAEHRPLLIEIEGNGHDCCWAEQWPQLVQQAFY